jgi:hypothetical protein
MPIYILTKLKEDLKMNLKQIKELNKTDKDMCLHIATEEQADKMIDCGLWDGDDHYHADNAREEMACLMAAAAEEFGCQ